MKRLRIRSAALTAMAVSLISAAAARADGLPVLGVDAGGTGVLMPSASSRLVTIPAAGNTVVAQVRTSTGMVIHSNLLTGTFTIPAVAYDGSAGGLSHDGRTLVLIAPRIRFPRANTSLLVLDARSLGPKQVVRFRGDFSFDAVSPAGRWIYLINYTSPTDPTRYAVRAFDTMSGQLEVRPVVDPREPGEKMRGNPMSRVMSADGRWAYTLYDGAGGTPFVHALDTTARSARCIDLDALTGVTDLSNVRLRIGSGTNTLSVMRGRTTLAVVDLRTFSASTPSDASLNASVTEIALVGACAVAALAASVFWFLRKRRRRLVVSLEPQA